MSSKNVALTIFLVTPVGILAALLWLVSMSITSGTIAQNHNAVVARAASASAPAAAEAPAAEAQPAPAAPAAAPRLVAPESLPQGFILLVTDKSGMASASSPIYLASNHNGWNAGDPAMKLAGRSDGKWQIILRRPTDRTPMAFKFTRGSWDRAEIDDKLQDIPNRSLPLIDPSKLAAGEKPIIEFVIPKFADQRPGSQPERLQDDTTREIVATGDVRRLQVVGGGGPAAGAMRDLLVWLPPGYDNPENATRSYPVLYMMDGQNIFQQLPGVPGEWGVDETATMLITEGKVEPVIIVGIPNAGASRAIEYGPVMILEGKEPGADAFVQFLLSEVMPRVERSFRVKTGPENTAIGGSSLGATISLYAATRRPDVFGKVLAESPALQLRSVPMLKPIFESVTTWPKQVYVAMGDTEVGPDPANAELNASYVKLAQDLKALLDKNNVRNVTTIAKGAVHNENAWRERFPAALEFLFPAK